MSLAQYLKSFSYLRTDKNRKRWSALTTHQTPHKPFLLLSIMDLIAQGSININFIDLFLNFQIHSILIETVLCLLAQKIDQDEPVGFREVFVANSIQVEALIMLMIDKNFVTKGEYFAKLKQVQMEYKGRESCWKLQFMI